MHEIIQITAEAAVTPFQFFAYSALIVAISFIPAAVIAYRNHQAIKRTEAAIRAEATAEYKAFHARYGNTHY